MEELLRKNYRRLKSWTRILKRFYWTFLNWGYSLGIFSIYDIPVVINNFNRLTFTVQLLGFLEKCGFTNIIILDNNSTYPPLLNFYDSCKHKVIRSKVNYGHLAFWKSGLYRRYRWDYFVYTDPDVLPVEACPKDFIVYFKSLLDENSQLDKVGFGLRIDDLPDSFDLKKRVVDYEMRHWEKEVKPNVFDAPIDTTLALYKPWSDLKFGQVYTLNAFRTGNPYVARHLSWYVDSANLSEEERYYAKTSNDSSSTVQHQLGLGGIY